MHTRSLPSARSRQVLAAIVAFALVSVFVIRTSDAAFTVTTDNKDNLFTTGQLDLDNPLTAPMFGNKSVNEDIQTDAVNLAEGDVRQACIEITYTGTFAAGQLSEVSLAVAGGEGANDLVDSLEFQMARTNTCGDAPPFGAAGDLAALAGDTGWAPDSPSSTQAFHFRATVLEGAPMDAVAEEINLTWFVSTIATN
ncbi:MAG: hypothetical protein EA387_03725 [Nitriliruptor sp.]|nr:MAG: hypothetical protein EA387_03725 [Nitriliruptor sp.]